ncbi:MAG TPA: right-handed parallel beta-helix repeat-containing protein, partial [Polyangiaceae bacterium]|nr:right-handed parallel beta-helix repeat-containing protein [Polyangiaceae bacterium]
MLSGSTDVLVDEVWIHDTSDRGIDAESTFGETSIVVQRSLLEGNQEVGAFFAGAEGTIDATVIRDALPDEQGAGGQGILVTMQGASIGRLHLRRTLVERSRELGVSLYGSEATVESTVIRDSPADHGRGINSESESATNTRSRLVVQRSLFERNRDVGIFVTGSDATIEATVVRDTHVDANGEAGVGLYVGDTGSPPERANVVVEQSLFERNHEAGVLVVGSDATIHGTVARDTVPDAKNRSRGISIRHNDTGSPANVTVQASLCERLPGVGLLVKGSQASIEATLVRDISANPLGRFGRAVQVQGWAATGTSALIRASLLERTVEAGVFVAGPASVEVEACLVRDTAAANDGVLGDGLTVWSNQGPANASAIGLRIEQSDRAAVSSFGAKVALQSSLLICQSFDIGAEPWQGQPSLIEDHGEVLCGCPDPIDHCSARSYALQPPPELAE